MASGWRHPVRLWNVAAGKELRSIEAGTGLRVRFSADLSRLVAWTPGRLALWDLEKSKQIRSMDRKIQE
jgi:hypothetical protein